MLEENWVLTGTNWGIWLRTASTPVWDEFSKASLPTVTTGLGADRSRLRAMREPVTMTSSIFWSVAGASGPSAAMARCGDATPPSAAATASETKYGAALMDIERRLSATVFRVVIDTPPRSNLYNDGSLESLQRSRIVSR